MAKKAALVPVFAQCRAGADRQGTAARRKRADYDAGRADGSLAHVDAKGGKQIGSIHGLGKVLEGAPSCNGWSFWHYENGGEVKPIDAARQLYLLAVED